MHSSATQSPLCGSPFCGRDPGQLLHLILHCSDRGGQRLSLAFLAYANRLLPTFCDRGHTSRDRLRIGLFVGCAQACGGECTCRLPLRFRGPMRLLAQREFRMQRPASLLEWNRWFAWYPVPLVIDGKLHHAWLQSVERRWGTSRYSGTIKWRYRLCKRSRSRQIPY